MTTTTLFDFALLRRAIEERDASSQLAYYDDDAQVTLVDRDHPPRAALVLSGRDDIRNWLDDTCARDMTHRVEHEVVADGRAAFTEACRYPDGTNVLSATVLELADGRIVRQLSVKAWDP